MDYEKTIFCGSGKKISDTLVSMSIRVSDLPKEWIKESKNGKSYIRLDLVKRKEPDEWGNTHFIKVNVWKPESEKKVEKDKIDLDNLPFL